MGKSGICILCGPKCRRHCFNGIKEFIADFTAWLEFSLLIKFPLEKKIHICLPRSTNWIRWLAETIPSHPNASCYAHKCLQILAVEFEIDAVTIVKTPRQLPEYFDILWKKEFTCKNFSHKWTKPSWSNIFVISASHLLHNFFNFVFFTSYISTSLNLDHTRKGWK